MWGKAGDSEYNRFVKKLKNVPYKDRIRVTTSAKKREQSRFLHDLAIRDREILRIREQANLEPSPPPAEVQERREPAPFPSHFGRDGAIQKRRHTQNIKSRPSEFERGRNASMPFILDCSDIVRGSQCFSQEFSSTDERVLNQLNVYVESEEIEEARRQQLQAKREFQEYTFKKLGAEREGQASQESSSSAYHQAATLAGIYDRTCDGDARTLLPPHRAFRRKEGRAHNKENEPVNSKKQWVRFNVDVEQGRHKFADYREVGEQSECSTVGQLVDSWKRALVEDGLSEREADKDWEIRSSRGFKFQPDQRVSSIYRHRAQPEVAVHFQKRSKSKEIISISCERARLRARP